MNSGSHLHRRCLKNLYVISNYAILNEYFLEIVPIFSFVGERTAAKSYIYIFYDIILTIVLKINIPPKKAARKSVGFRQKRDVMIHFPSFFSILFFQVLDVFCAGRGFKTVFAP